jgi:ubiquitin-conjugating enzyme E2 J1
MLLTPNGRFELNKKVCLTSKWRLARLIMHVSEAILTDGLTLWLIVTVTGFHEESWQPAWGIRTALVGLSVSCFPSWNTPAEILTI